MSQKLVTKAIQAALKKYPIYSQDGKKDQALVIARYFLPGSGLTTYILEGDPVTGECFGCQSLTGPAGFEYGYIDLDQLLNIRIRFQGRLSLPIERDISIIPGKKTLGECMAIYGESMIYG